MPFLQGEERFSGSPYLDLILLELNIPKKDGREVLKEIREDRDLFWLEKDYRVHLLNYKWWRIMAILKHSHSTFAQQ